MPRKNLANNRGINRALPAEEVKSERFTLKFTPGDFNRILRMMEVNGLERMSWARETLMKAITEMEKPPSRGPIEHPQDDAVGKPPDTTVEQLREQGMAVGDIAKKTGLSAKAVRKMLGLK